MENKFNKLVFENKNKVEYVEVIAHFKDDEDYQFETIIKIGNRKDNQGVSDDNIFYYCKNSDEFKSLLKDNNGEDFIIDDIKSVF